MTTYPALFLFAGSGLGALGFQEASATLRGVDARFTIAGAVDNDPACARDFERLTGHPCAVADIGMMTPAELRAACTVPPAALFASPPCKGNSGCLPAARASEDVYQAMNRLAVVSMELVLEAWPDSPPRLILLENVPRITVRSRPMLDELGELLRDNGYAVRETSHDCGELGELAQRRRRFHRCGAPDPDGRYGCDAEIGHDGEHTWSANPEKRAARIDRPMRRWRFE